MAIIADTRICEALKRLHHVMGLEGHEVKRIVIDIDAGKIITAHVELYASNEAIEVLADLCKGADVRVVGKEKFDPAEA